MFTLLKIIFGSYFSKTTTKVYHDSRLGKMTCEINEKDEFYFWEAKIKKLNKNKEETVISIEGDINGPNSNLIENANNVLSEFSDYTFIVQKELEIRFPANKINLSADYYIDSISLYLEEDSDFEIDFCSDIENMKMVSVEFKDKNLLTLDLY